MNLKFWQLALGNWTLRIDRFVRAGKPANNFPKTNNLKNPPQPNKQAKFTKFFCSDRDDSEELGIRNWEFIDL